MTRKFESIFNSEAQAEIQARAEELAEKLKAEGWVDSPDNPTNEMVYYKKCSSCGSEIIDRLTKTAPLTKEEIKRIIEKAKEPEQCLTCLERGK